MLVISTRFLSDPIVNGLSEQFNMRRHDVLHNALIPHDAAGQKQLIRPNARARRFDQRGNSLERFQFHSQHMHGSNFDISAQLLFHRFHEGVAVLVSVYSAHVFDMLGWGGTEQFEDILFVGAKEFPLSLGIEKFSVFGGFFDSVKLWIIDFFSRLEAVEDEAESRKKFSEISKIRLIVDCLGFCIARHIETKSTYRSLSPYISLAKSFPKSLV
jgi:hypothetical protein